MLELNFKMLISKSIFDEIFDRSKVFLGGKSIARIAEAWK
jgi:hypothetical protein